MTHRINYSGNKQRGFTLLEVLIALLVLSIGLLGLAALQTTGLRSNEMASMRTTATQLAYDISDRMRANPGRAAAAPTTPPDPDPPSPFGVADNEYLLAPGTTPTDTTSVAKNDLVEWHTEVAKLPGGRASITQCDGTSTPPCDGITHIITVQWDEMRTGAEGTACPPVAETDLRCYRLIFSE